MFKTNANFDINIMSIIFQQDCGVKQQSLTHSTRLYYVFNYATLYHFLMDFGTVPTL